MFWLNDPSVASPLSADNLSRSEKYTLATAGANGDFYVNIGNVKSATNLISNGDFSNTTGWSNTQATLSAASNVLSAVGNGTGATLRTQQTYAFVNTRKYYARAMVRVTDTVCSQIALGTVTAAKFKSQLTPTQNTWYTLSGVMTAASDTYLAIRTYYADAATANGKTTEVKYVLSLDLTTIYGAGNEPTASEMDTIMSQFTNSWFDGTTVLYPLPLALNDIVSIAFPTATNGASNARLSLDGGTNYKDIKLSTIRIASEVASKRLSFVYDGTDFVPLETEFFPIAYTPTVTTTSGALTTITVSGQYIIKGKFTYVWFSLLITNKGTAVGPLKITLPSIPSKLADVSGVNRHTGTATNFLGTAGSAELIIYNYDGLSTITNNDTHIANAVYFN